MDRTLTHAREAGEGVEGEGQGPLVWQQRRWRWSRHVEDGPRRDSVLGEGGGSRVWTRTLQARVMVFRISSPARGAGVDVLRVWSGTGSRWNVAATAAAASRCHSNLPRGTEDHWTVGPLGNVLAGKAS